MAFNPFRDLDPNDRKIAITQLGGANTEDLSGIGDKLKTTSRLTKGLVEVLRRKNANIKSDYDRIRELDTRIKRVIPIIPGMGGVAGSLYGSPKPPPPSTPPTGGLPGRIPRMPRPTPRPPQREPKPVPEPQRQPDFSNIREIIQKLLEFGYTLEQIRRILEGITEGLSPGVAAAPLTLDDVASAEAPGKKRSPAAPGVMPRPEPISIPGLTEEQTKLSIQGEKALANGSDPPFLANAYKVLNEYFQKSGGASGSVPTPDGGILTVTRGGLFNPRPIFNYKPGRQWVAAQKQTAEIAKYAPLFQSVTDVLGAVAGITSKGRSTNALAATTLAKPQVARPVPATPLPQVRPDQRPSVVPPTVRKPVPVPDVTTKPIQPKPPFTPVTPDADRILGGPRNKPTKKAPGKTKVEPQQRLFGPDKLSGVEIQETVNILGDKSAMTKGLAPAGTIASFLGLDRGSIRIQFLEYLTGGKFVDGVLTSPKLTKSGVQNFGFYEKVLRQIGLIKGSTPPKQVDDDVFRFLINYHKKFKMSPNKLIMDMLQNQMIDPSTTIGNPRMRAIIDEAIKGGSNPGDEFTLPPSLRPFSEQYQYEDLQSLNIDTSRETDIYIVLTGPKPANA